MANLFSLFLALENYIIGMCICLFKYIVILIISFFLYNYCNAGITTCTGVQQMEMVCGDLVLVDLELLQYSQTAYKLSVS